MTETRSVRVRVSADVADLIRGYQQAAREGDTAMGKLRTGADRAREATVSLETEVEGIGQEVRRSSAEIDRFSGRLSLARDAILTLGTAAVPLAAGLTPALVGTAVQLGVVTAAAGVAVLAFNGVGDALEALNEYQLEPTPENLIKLNEELQRIGPAGAEFVSYLDSLGPQLRSVQNAAREGLLPGVAEGIDEALERLPQVRGLVSEISTTLGGLATDAGAGLGGDELEDFFDYLDREAAPLLDGFVRSLGNVSVGLANLVVGFDPVTSAYSEGLQEMTRDFAEWSQTLDSNQGFQNLLAYIQQSGPQVVDFLGATASAIAGLAQATAPLGATVLPALTALLEVFAAIASSPVGPPLLIAAAGLAAYSRAGKIASGVSTALESGLGRVGVNAERSSGALSRAGRAARAAGTGFVALQVGVATIDALQAAGKDALPTVNELAQRLIALGRGDLGSIGSDMGDLGDSIGRLADPNLAERLGDTTLSIVSLGFLEGNRLSDAKDQIGLLDQALQGLAAQGGAEAAQEAFDGLARSENLTAAESERLLSLLPGFRDSLAAAGVASDLAADGTGRFTSAAEEAAAAALAERAAIAAANKALVDRRNVALAAFDAETAWRQAVNEATDAANRNGAGIRGNSKQALENRQRISALAAAWNNQSEAVRANEGRQREARRVFLRTAESMGIGAREARRLADDVLAIPNSREIRLRTNAQAAIDQIRSIQRSLEFIRDEDVFVNIYQRRIGAERAGSSGFGPQLADGGYVAGPGGPRDDRIPALLSNGEFVVNAAATAANRPLLETINRKRFADGGLAGVVPATALAPQGAQLVTSGAAATSLDGIRVTGELDTPWGPARIEGIARETARNVVREANDTDSTVERMSWP